MRKNILFENQRIWEVLSSVNSMISILYSLYWWVTGIVPCAVMCHTSTNFFMIQQET